MYGGFTYWLDAAAEEPTLVVESWSRIVGYSGQRHRITDSRRRLSTKDLYKLMAPTHPAESLWSRHQPSAGYPPGVLAVPTPIPGVAFFPGGFGLWGAQQGRPLPPMPMGGVMILGHDFHSEDGYQRSLARGGEPMNAPTWNALLKVLRDADIAPEICFFTNFYMGLRNGTKTTGRFPGAGDTDFVSHCEAFFLEQLRTQQPKLVVTLGAHVPLLLSKISPALASWSTRGFRSIDMDGPLKTGVQFVGANELTTSVAALLHPSFRHASVKRRRYRG